MRLKRKEAGVYVTEDGRYEISKGHCYTECEGPHPVRVGREARQEIRRASYGSSPISPGWASVVRKYGPQACNAVLEGGRGYFCEGGEEHWRVSWGAWDLATDDYVSGGEDFETMTHAIAFLEGMI